jgi:hypothetical protein
VAEASERGKKMIRRKKLLNANGVSFSPVFETLSSSGIQNVIKSRITKEDFNKFLNSKIIAENFKDYEKIIDIEGTLYSGLDKSQRKYLFDLIIVILYEEIMQFPQIESIILSNINQALVIFEKMVVLEYDLFFIEGNTVPSSSIELDKVYIEDNIRELYYGTNLKNSYKDLGNLKTEVQAIYSNYVAENPFPVSSGIPSNFFLADGSFNYSLFFRINGNSSEIEKNTSIYSFLFNYNSLSSVVMDRTNLRKFLAFSNGFYYKDNEKKTLDGLTSYSYYGLLSNTFSSSYRNAQLFLTGLWDKMLDGTINY